MAVYTEVTFDEASELLQQLQLGTLTQLTACSGGIENTNYFASTELAGQAHDYVLTLFERLNLTQLPFYLQFMQHLGQRGIPVAQPHANQQGQLAFMFKGKPCAVVDKLRGKSELTPTPWHCAQIGSMLAHMHQAGRNFALQQPNLRGLTWWNETAAQLQPHLSPTQQQLSQSELAFQNQLAVQLNDAALPRGPVHTDLFRDNVMFDGNNDQPQLSGIIDFYFAGIDSWLFDLAVCLNDWSIDPDDASLIPQNAEHLIASYNAIRPLLDVEKAHLNSMLRAAALRFWISRLSDFFQPRPASLLKAHDPNHFERVLRQRIAEIKLDELTTHP
jgi:homoserine kinase type II